MDLSSTIAIAIVLLVLVVCVGIPLRRVLKDSRLQTAEEEMEHQLTPQEMHTRLAYHIARGVIPAQVATLQTIAPLRSPTISSEEAQIIVSGIKIRLIQYRAAQYVL